MSDLEELKKKLASEIADSGFELEQRTATALLKHIADYTAQIPFASDKDASWNSFWLGERSPDQLAAVYQDRDLAAQQLPVQQAFLLAVLQLLETPKRLLNTVPARHRLLYYRDLLGFTPRGCQPDSVAVSFTLLRNTPAYLLPAGTALDAGQDQMGNALTYLTDQSLLITPQQLVQICWTRLDQQNWVVSTAQDLDKNISLPAEGTRLFGATSTESALKKQTRQDLTLAATVGDCQHIGYRAQDGEGHINTFSFPFSIEPRMGNAFEIILPVEFSRTGGELTLMPHWHDLPAQSFAGWYAKYPDAPANNAVFTVRLDLLTSDGTELRGKDQPLFSGESAPQPEPLRVTLPADHHAERGYTLRGVLTGSDFFHRSWQDNQQDKNPPWTPQVTRFTPTFQAAPAEARVTQSLSHAQDSATEHQVLYLGFRDVAPGETLSLYWSLSAPSALNLSWFCYSQAGTWVPLAAGVQDGTGGLSGSGLWQATLPADCAKGGEYTHLSDDYYWIKATEANGEDISEDNTARLSAVIAGAVTATLNTASGVDASHFARPLPASSISQLVAPVVEISHVNQLLSSTGGQVGETQAAMLKRAAARIAHRQRGISWGNMRSLLLDNYSQLYDVQFPDTEKLNRIPAMEVQQLMAIPDSRQRDNDDALRPTLSAQRLATMTEWLKQYCSLWATPELLNPTYVDVKADFRVLFSSGISPEWGYSQLASWLEQRYMPWGEDQRQAVTPGNQIDYFQLLATLQQSPWVQRVISLTLRRDYGIPQQQSVIASDNEVLILIPYVPENNRNGEFYV